MPQTVSGHPPLFSRTRRKCSSAVFSSPRQPVLRGRLRDSPRSQQASPRHQQPPRPSPRHLSPKHTFSATVMVLVAVSATPAPPCRVSATATAVSATSPRRLRDASATSPRRLRGVSATSPRHIHIHTPDTGIPPHVVIRNLEVHMGLAERLSRELPRECARYFG